MGFCNYFRGLLALGLLTGGLLRAPEAMASYFLSYGGIVTGVPVGVQYGDGFLNGPTTLCSPSGAGACGPVVGANASSYSRGSIPEGALDVVLTGNAATGGTYVQLNGKVLGLTGDDPGPGMDAILHVTYGWTIVDGGSMRLQAHGSGGFGPPSSFDTLPVYVSRTESEMALRANVAAYDEYGFQFFLDFNGATFGASENVVNGWVRFWLELPEGTTLSTANFGVGGVPLAAQVAAPAPAGAAILPGLMALAALRRGRDARKGLLFLER